MRTKAAALCLVTVITLLSGIFSPWISAGAADYTVGEIEALAGGIISYKLGETGSGSVQDWIDGALAQGAGESSEWFVIGLSQSGDYDFSTYSSALESFTADRNIISATTRQKYALALIASGSTSDYIAQTAADSIGQLGIMSWDYGLHLLNNGCRGDYSADEVIDSILSMQFPDGGWAVMGEYGDVDVTAMTVNALAPYYYSNGSVQYAVDSAVDFLSAKQQDSGGFKTMGTENPESSAQVITALSALGIDCQHDDRFLKEGNSPIDGMLRYQLPDGSFSHTEGGGTNDSATVQAYYSLVAYQRMVYGQGPLLVLDHLAEESAQEPEPAEPETPQITPETSGSPDEPAVPTAPGTPQVQSGDTPSPQVTSPAQGTSHRVQTGTSSAASTVTGTQLSTASAKSVENSTASTSSTAVRISSSAASTVTSAATVSSIHYPLTSAAADVGDGTGSTGSYKPIAIVVILAAAAVLSLILAALGKRSWKNLLAVGIIAGAAIAVVLLTDIRSTEEYYSGAVHKEASAGTVTMTIRCDTIADQQDSPYAPYIPEDGVILDTTEFEFEEGDTVYTVLTDAAQAFSIQTDTYGGFTGLVYVAGLNYLYEYQFGDLSGWIYHVNGVAPSVGCAEYTVSDGDVIEWLYTLEVGNDLPQLETESAP